MNATTVQNVVTYDAIIDLDNPEQKLLPGMTAYVTVPVASVTASGRCPMKRGAPNLRQSFQFRQTITLIFFRSLSS